MRSSQMLLLAIAFLALASDVATEASVGVEGIPCTTSIIPSPKPCDNNSCNQACIDRVWVGGYGECVAGACKCQQCTYIPPKNGN
ncbi:hypothetical protein CFC21_110814 [Triticum aestivum]|nr:uncharacterized protein LOC120968166 [Aegilops tauschii subsp. strangulata]XP_044438955.1 uncharacterized protein LOC123165384 [Triticum aestivum]KAF7110730.1 hypothetical protein CFC21_110814 [Triticum aestivum]